MRRVAIVLVLLAAACSSKHTPNPSPKLGPTASPSASPTVDARTVDSSSLVRPGTKVTKTVYADMNGDGTEEIAIWSRATTSPEGSFLKQSYVEVFSYATGGNAQRPNGSWMKIFDGTRPDVITVEPNVVSQDVSFFDFVDFRGDGKPDLVSAIQNVGASEGPLDIWALSWKGAGTFDVDFNYSTDRGGNLTEHGKQLSLDTGAYKPSDPGCCPSGTSHIVIGYADGKVRVISRTDTPNPSQP